MLAYQGSGIKLGTFKSVNESLTRVVVYISLMALYCLGGSKVKAVRVCDLLKLKSFSVSLHLIICVCTSSYCLKIKLTTFHYFSFAHEFAFLSDMHLSFFCWQGELSVGTVASFIGYTFTLTFAVSQFLLFICAMSILSTLLIVSDIIGFSGSRAG